MTLDIGHWTLAGHHVVTRHHISIAMMMLKMMQQLKQDHDWWIIFVDRILVVASALVLVHSLLAVVIKS